jgi:hypothetical protein
LEDGNGYEGIRRGTKLVPGISGRTSVSKRGGCFNTGVSRAELPGNQPFAILPARAGKVPGHLLRSKIGKDPMGQH